MMNQDNADKKNKDIYDKKVAGDDHIHDQHEYPIDYADDDEDFELSDHDSRYNIDFEIGENSNLNRENENEIIDDETDDTIADDNIDLQKGQSHVTHDYVSPGGSPYWIPVVSDHNKPKINSTLDSYGATLSMYKNYASEPGFDVRLGTIRATKFGIITQRHLLCNRESKPITAKVDTLDLQHNKIQRMNIIIFKEGKTHLGVNAKQKLFLFYYMILINILLMILSNNILLSCLVRTTCFCLVQRGNLIILRRCLFTTCQSKILVPQEHIDCIPDFRVGLTFELGCKIPCCQDAGKEKKYPNFFFEFKVVQKKLNTLFWADETAKYNYNSFGDVISLDATFSMNNIQKTTYACSHRSGSSFEQSCK
uniref:Uncharacterized protein n=1 Tax=Lactuca sativa TaxID=4236 RepID=A0A9R1VXD8_LACSA|nr:hypothetical protein LSAT_V11C300111870 [Lactuca sativa]